MKKKKTVPNKSAKYDNWRIEAKDGFFIGFCDKDKVDWYRSRNLADLVGPLTIRLKFQPKINPSAPRPSQAAKETICVVCGTKERLTRHHVIPKIYRQEMPISLKKHRSEHIVLLCEECHWKYEEAADEVKKGIAKRFGVPLTQPSPKRKMFEYTLTLRAHGQKMPKEKKRYFEEELEKLKKEEWAADVLALLNKRMSKRRLSQLRKKISRETNYHGQKVVALLSKKENGLTSFISEWRDHFVKSMAPKFLPADWN